MISGTAQISTRGPFGPEPASISGNRAGTGMLVHGETQDLRPGSLDLAAMTEEFNHKINMIHNVDLQFSIHEGSGQVLVKVTDAGSGEVIREIPPSEMLDLAARLDEMIGLLFDQVG
jgi:uncharacterized FlaG/YvyC family protein